MAIFMIMLLNINQDIYEKMTSRLSFILACVTFPYAWSPLSASVALLYRQFQMR